MEGDSQGAEGSIGMECGCRRSDRIQELTRQVGFDRVDTCTRHGGRLPPGQDLYDKLPICCALIAQQAGAAIWGQAPKLVIVASSSLQQFT